MTNQTITRNLRGPCGKGYEKVNTWQRNLPASVDEQEECQKRTTIWEILFRPPWRKNNGGYAGAEMQPFVVYMPGGSYTVTDRHHNLAAACHTGPAASLAELWQNPHR